MPLKDFDFDAVVVGAGAIGLACARALAKAGGAVVVLEKERRYGEGVSSRNSEVAHAGFYYPTGSLKARFCVRGRRLLYPFLETHGVAHKRCGKLLVATEPDHLARLESLARQGEANDVEGLSFLSGAQARALEPNLACAAALLSAESGVIDSHGYMTALVHEFEGAGGHLALGAPFEGATPLDGGGFAIRVGGADPATFTARRLVTAAGLGAQEVAGAIAGYPIGHLPARRLGKGVYFRLAGKAPFKRLVYPPPIHGALGTHYRCDLGGQAVFGPDLEYVETEDYRVDPARAEEFTRSIRAWWPQLPDGALTPDYAGIRPKTHGPGEPQPDFQMFGPVTHGVPGLIAMFGMESPGLTSSLAIGEALADEAAAVQLFGFEP